MEKRNACAVHSYASLCFIMLYHTSSYFITLHHASLCFIMLLHRVMHRSQRHAGDGHTGDGHTGDGHT
eukprot:366462-Chlamydomonas_euryale.AAC.2